MFPTYPVGDTTGNVDYNLYRKICSCKSAKLVRKCLPKIQDYVVTILTIYFQWLLHEYSNVNQMLSFD